MSVEFNSQTVLCMCLENSLEKLCQLTRLEHLHLDLLDDDALYQILSNLKAPNVTNLSVPFFQSLVVERSIADVEEGLFRRLRRLTILDAWNALGHLLANINWVDEIWGASNTSRQLCLASKQPFNSCGYSSRTPVWRAYHTSRKLSL